MGEQKPFKVVIVGGSLSGLALANMLQLNGIDFVLLEAYPTIAPQIGASIGFLSQSCRIFDQLGLYKTILPLVSPLESFTFRTSEGAVLASHKGVRNSLIQR